MILYSLLYYLDDFIWVHYHFLRKMKLLIRRKKENHKNKRNKNQTLLTSHDHNIEFRGPVNKLVPKPISVKILLTDHMFAATQ